MSFETYNVFFSGQIMQDRDPTEVRRKVGKLFKLEGAKLERMFSGQPVAIKRHVDMELAMQYRVAFRQAGALVDIHPAARAPAEPNAAAGSATNHGAAQGLSLSAPRAYDLSDCAPALAPQELPDISRMCMHEPGVILDTSQPAEPLQIDTEGWQLDRPGVELDESEPTPTALIDTSALTLNPANQGSLAEFERVVTPAKLPIIEHLACIEPEHESSDGVRFRLSED
jgi:hypothetical protein